MVGARAIGSSAGGAGVHMARAGVHCGRRWRLLRPVGWRVTGGRRWPVAGGR